VLLTDEGHCNSEMEAGWVGSANKKRRKKTMWSEQ